MCSREFKTVTFSRYFFEWFINAVIVLRLIICRSKSFQNVYCNVLWKKLCGMISTIKSANKNSGLLIHSHDARTYNAFDWKIADALSYRDLYSLPALWYVPLLNGATFEFYAIYNVSSYIALFEYAIQTHTHTQKSISFFLNIKHYALVNIILHCIYT